MTDSPPSLVFQARITNSLQPIIWREREEKLTTDFGLFDQDQQHHDCRDSDGGERVGPPHGRAHRQGRPGPQPRNLRRQRRRLGHAGTGFYCADSYFRNYFDIFPPVRLHFTTTLSELFEVSPVALLLLQHLAKATTCEESSTFAAVLNLIFMQGFTYVRFRYQEEPAFILSAQNPPNPQTKITKVWHLDKERGVPIESNLSKLVRKTWQGLQKTEGGSIYLDKEKEVPR